MSVCMPPCGHFRALGQGCLLVVRPDLLDSSAFVRCNGDPPQFALLYIFRVRLSALVRYQ